MKNDWFAQYTQLRECGPHRINPTQAVWVAEQERRYKSNELPANLDMERAWEELIGSDEWKTFFENEPCSEDQFDKWMEMFRSLYSHVTRCSQFPSPFSQLGVWLSEQEQAYLSDKLPRVAQKQLWKAFREQGAEDDYG